MKFLHTSDWHLGRFLYMRKRYDEFSLFLAWLAETIEKEKIDVLLVAGDVFDTGTPSNRAQELYYRFLCRVSASCCRHVVITAGNHDSPSFLNAPREVLRALNVYVVGSMTEDVNDEVITLERDGQAAAIVCAVPYLRDRDLRLVEPGETIDDKNSKLIEGLKKHYAEVCAIAEQKRQEFAAAGQGDIPIIALGHLFTDGGKTVDGDGVRELYVGSLAHVSRDAFPAAIDYLALGHLHVAQAIAGAEHIRYCGSPIAMGFGEVTQEKKVVLIEFHGKTPIHQELTVPCFQQLLRIVGALDEILARLEQLKGEKSRAWLEIEYTGNETIGNLREMLEEAVNGSDMEILRIRDKRKMEQMISASTTGETLDDLKPGEVFERCMDAFKVPGEERAGLTASYNEILQSLQDDDSKAE
ncbi:MAG: exonuclease SbcCD subunit D C-terminal domain-containing protein [Lentisphaeria bacterium]